jgi:hypothetical protein
VSYRRIVRAFLFPAAVCALACAGWANPVLVASFPNYSLVPLGSIQNGVPGGYFYEGLGFSGGQLLLSGGGPGADPGNQFVYSVPVTRDGSGAIDGFGTATAFGQVPMDNTGTNGILPGGGLLIAPNGTLLYTTGISNGQDFIGQYAPSSTTSSLTQVGIGGSAVPLGGLSYIDGRLMLSSTNGTWYQVTLSSPDANGIYQVSVNPTIVATTIPTDAFAGTSLSVGGSAGAVLLGDSTDQQLALYGIDSQGNLTGPTVKIVDGNGEPIGYGLTQDPLHPQSYLFTTFNNDIWMLTVPSPEPSAAFLVLGGIALLMVVRRKPRR